MLNSNPREHSMNACLHNGICQNHLHLMGNRLHHWSTTLRCAEIILQGTSCSEDGKANINVHTDHVR